MILSPWYCWASITDPAPPLQHFNDLACKYFEFFPLWFFYIRHWRPDEHIYIVDCGSPLPIEHILPWLGEPFEIITGQDNFKLDMTVKLHIKKYVKRLDHLFGSSRTAIDYLKMCFLHGLDYCLIESDVLIGYDVWKDFEGMDFVTQKIRSHESTITEGAICFISTSTIRDRFRDGSMNRYLDGNVENKNFHEGEYFSLFCRGRVKELSRPKDYVHKCTAQQLRRFVYHHCIPHPYVNIFMNALSYKIEGKLLGPNILTQIYPA